MKVFRKIIAIDEEKCDGCGQCVPGCAEGALQIIEGKARVVADKYCDGLGACIGECPTGALRLVERESDEFDEVAVEAYLSEKEKEKNKEPSVLPCGCPSTQIQTFIPNESCKTDNLPASLQGGVESALSHWPIQIRLIPPTAPFLKEADLLVLADCCAVAYARLHRDLITGKVVMMGCPKFDDVQDYIQKFTEIFKAADIRTITTVIMEVPCCSGLPMIAKKGMEAAGKKIPVKEIIITTQGNVLGKS
jgi:NAD-dependent dihydropyrimidine dehydrogenase PreA subunit